MNAYDDGAIDEDRPKYLLPSRHGISWSHMEDQSLSAAWISGRYSLAQLATKHRRTADSIAARLTHLNHDPDNRPTSKEVLKVRSKLDMNVKLTHLITLLQKGYTTIAVQFIRDPNSEYVYKVSDEIAKSLAIDDLVVVPTKNHFSVGKVLRIDEEPQIDICAPYALKWVAQKVDLTQYNEQATREAEAVAMLEREQRKRAQEKALDELLGSNREELLAIINRPAKT